MKLGRIILKFLSANGQIHIRIVVVEVETTKISYNKFAKLLAGKQEIPI